MALAASRHSSADVSGLRGEELAQTRHILQPALRLHDAEPRGLRPRTMGTSFLLTGHCAAGYSWANSSG